MKLKHKKIHRIKAEAALLEILVKVLKWRVHLEGKTHTIRLTLHAV